MIDAGLTADIDIREFAMKAGAAAHIVESALRYVENARDVLRCCVRVGAIEWNDKRNRYSYPVQGLRHNHYCIGAERMPNEDNRSAVARTIARGNFAYDCVRFGVIVNARFDAMPGDYYRQLIHAERKNVHQATHQVNMGEAHRLVSILRRSPRRGGGSTGNADDGIGTTHNQAT